MNSIGSGEIINLISNDARKIEMTIYFFNYLWVNPSHYLVLHCIEFTDLSASSYQYDCDYLPVLVFCSIHCSHCYWIYIIITLHSAHHRWNFCIFEVRDGSHSLLSRY